jgi:CheY-like chemotaxis protein
VIANNGYEAVAVAERGDFDLVLMDVQMPELDGFEATASLRAHEQATNSRTPIIAMTAHALKATRTLSGRRDGWLSSKPDSTAGTMGAIERLTAVPASAKPNSELEEKVFDRALNLDEKIKRLERHLPRLWAGTGAVRLLTSTGDEMKAENQTELKAAELQNTHRVMAGHHRLSQLGSSWTARAEGAASDLTQYRQEVWRVEQGLPPKQRPGAGANARWLSLARHIEGLVRFDGVRFTVFDKSNTPVMKNHNVLALGEDREGNLWIGTGGGLLRYRAGSFTLYTTAKAWRTIGSRRSTKTARRALDRHGWRLESSRAGALYGLHGQRRFAEQSHNLFRPGRNGRALDRDAGGLELLQGRTLHYAQHERRLVEQSGLVTLCRRGGRALGRD